MRSIIAALLCCAMLPCLAAPTCVAVGGFASAMPCCAGLVRDANQRCQLPTCKQDGVRAVVQANGVSDCCIGMVVIGGVCRVPTLHRSVCAILGDQPTGNRTCCSGLARNAATGRCAPSGLSCNAEQIGTCCHGVGKTVNTCNCYCPNQYYN